MSQFFYVGNYGGPLRTEVFEDDGVTEKLPVSATVTIINKDSGDTLVSGEACQVETGSAYYLIPSGSSVTSSSGHMVAYMDVLVESGNLLTNRIPFDVLSKASFLVIDKWLRKVENAAPSTSLLEDEDARDWIDSAVAFVNRRYGDQGYTSTLGDIDPAPTANDLEFFAEVASLMARTSWWAGRGKWRDEEMSFDPGPFKQEWDRLDFVMEAKNSNDLFQVVDEFNRDRVVEDGRKLDSPSYWYVLSGSVAPTTTIPV